MAKLDEYIIDGSELFNGYYINNFIKSSFLEALDLSLDEAEKFIEVMIPIYGRAIKIKLFEDFGKKYVQFILPNETVRVAIVNTTATRIHI
ncbi:MAG: hypothetical protein HUJ68_10535 [Clostridia bacterium]|nr:hypothetical protein [Clostridia bacterium]